MQEVFSENIEIITAGDILLSGVVFGSYCDAGKWVNQSKVYTSHRDRIDGAHRVVMNPLGALNEDQHEVNDGSSSNLTYTVSRVPK